MAQRKNSVNVSSYFCCCCCYTKVVHGETHLDIRKDGARKSSVQGALKSREAQSYPLPHCVISGIDMEY